MGGTRKRNQTSEPCFSLETVCALLELDARTLRGYERRGLIRLRWIRMEEGSRTALFTQTELRRARRIRILTEEMGVNLPGVEIILRLLDRIESE